MQAIYGRLTAIADDALEVGVDLERAKLRTAAGMVFGAVVIIDDVRDLVAKEAGE